MEKLKGKVILVTGGSRGIGAGIVKTLAQQGASIAFTYTSRPESAEDVLNSLPGDNHLCLKMNVADETSVTQAIVEVQKKYSQLHGLVNNAGITRDQLLLRMKTEDFDSVLQTNLRGTYFCVKSVLKPMIKAKGGSIVSITSVIGQKGNGGQSNYAASKAGIEAFSKSIAQEVGSRGIRVNCVAPGFIVTEMTDALDDKQKQSILEQIPLKTLGKVEDVAHAVSYLLSDESTYLTGQTISVNGGLYM